ncbi:MAG: hypothetical protein NVSMB5_24700 [Candidatus Velthaea sp.]
MDSALAAPVSLVVADEGYGKSTLIRDYLALRKIAHVRFTAGPEHALPSDLLRGIASAFGDIRPAMARSAAAASLKFGQIGAKGVARAWAREHLCDVDTVVVLDDLHHLMANAQCTDFITALIEESAPSVRWILALRDAAMFPVPRWLARDLVALPIEASELRVQPQEISAAFAAGGTLLTAAQAQLLYARTDGWPLGLTIALRSNDLDTITTRARVYDRVVDAALLRCSDAQRDRLFETAAAARFDKAFLAALECDAHFLEILVDSELIYALDGKSYAYFEPFRERLELRLEALPLKRHRRILDRSAAALERAGRWPEALALSVRAGDPQRVAALLDRVGFRALDRGETGAVGRALESLAEDVLMQHPTALGLKAALASIDEGYDVAEAWFNMAIQNARDGERRTLVLRYGLDLVRRGRPDVIELLEAETTRVESRANADGEAALWALLGTAYVAERRGENAREAASHALARLPGVHDPAVRARVLHQAAYVALDAGDYAAAKSLAERALARADEIFLYEVAARALSVLFNVAMLHEENVADARDALLRLEQAGRKAGNDALCLYAIVNAYSIEVDAGNLSALQRMNRELAEMQVLLTRMVSEGLLPAQALRAAWDGRFEHAYDMLAPGAEKMFDDDRIAYRWAEVAVYGAAAGKEPEARKAIALSRERVAGLDACHPLAVRATAYIALAEAMLGDDRAAAVSVAAARTSAAGLHRRVQSLVATVEAFLAFRAGGLESVVALAAQLDDLRRNDLGGVALLIGRLPLQPIAATALAAS